MALQQESTPELIVRMFRDVDVVECEIRMDPIPGARAYLTIWYRCKTCSARYTLNVEPDLYEDVQINHRIKAVLDDLWKTIEAPYDAHRCKLDLGPPGRP